MSFYKNVGGMVRPRNRGELLNEIRKRFKRGQYNLNDIDTSEITDMNSLFYSFYNFENIDISKLDISGWDVSNVRYMYKTFAMCRDFNCDLSKWDTKKVQNMKRMFYNSGMKEEPEWYLLKKYLL